MRMRTTRNRKARGFARHEVVVVGSSSSSSSSVGVTTTSGSPLFHLFRSFRLLGRYPGLVLMTMAAGIRMLRRTATQNGYCSWLYDGILDKVWLGFVW